MKYPKTITNSIEEKMKKILMTLATVLCCAMTTTVFTSCASDDKTAAMTPDDQSKQPAEATILWYGVGGGNVDAAILDMFRQVYKAKPESFDHVNVIAQYKASQNPTAYNGHSYETIVSKIDPMAASMTEEEIENLPNASYFMLCHPKPSATYRFAVDPKTTLRHQLLETEPYGEMNCDITCPDSLTNFINWAAKNYPAKKYILVMADHGGGYIPHVDIPETATSRGLIFDDGHNSKCFTAMSFAKAVRNASVRLEGIVLNLCLMNNLEFLYEVKDVTDYIACSTYIMNGTSGVLGTIPDNLAAGQDTKTALGGFIDATVDSWDNEFYDKEGAPLYYDLTLTETCRLNDLAPVLKEFTGRLVDTYQNGTEEQRTIIDECTAHAVKVQNIYPFYDMAKYMESFFIALPQVFDEAFKERLKTAFNACIAKQRYSRYLTEHNYQVDYSMILGTKGAYVTYSYDQIVSENAKLLGATVFYPDGTTATYNYIGDENNSSEGNLGHYEFVSNGTWPSTFADTYQQTAFDRLVGWSRWLLINQAAPPAWSPSSFQFQLPEDDMSDIPFL